MKKKTLLNAQLILGSTVLALALSGCGQQKQMGMEQPTKENVPTQLAVKNMAMDLQRENQEEKNIETGKELQNLKSRTHSLIPMTQAGDKVIPIFEKNSFSMKIGDAKWHQIVIKNDSNEPYTVTWDCDFQSKDNVKADVGLDYFQQHTNGVITEETGGQYFSSDDLKDVNTSVDTDNFVTSSIGKFAETLLPGESSIIAADFVLKKSTSENADILATATLHIVKATEDQVAVEKNRVKQSTSTM